MNGLILVGGRSVRMGNTDKSLITYHTKPQWVYLSELLQPFCEEIFLSCREEQKNYFPNQNLLIDPYQIGPLGGILSAFEYSKKTAWLVLACDMPFVVKETVAFLTQYRDKTSIATAFLNPNTKNPEPLLTIWESSAYSLLNEAKSNNQRSPLKVLHENNVKLVNCTCIHWLRNVNTVEEFEEIMLRQS